MTTPEHIDRLILALVIGTCIALDLGTYLIVTQQTDQVDRADRRGLSLFNSVSAGYTNFIRCFTGASRTVGDDVAMAVGEKMGNKALLDLQPFAQLRSKLPDRLCLDG